MDILHHLDSQQRQLLAVLDEVAYIFSDSPALCTVVDHELNVTSDFRLSHAGNSRTRNGKTSG